MNKVNKNNINNKDNIYKFFKLAKKEIESNDNNVKYHLYKIMFKENELNIVFDEYYNSGIYVYTFFNYSGHLSIARDEEELSFCSNILNLLNEFKKQINYIKQHNTISKDTDDKNLIFKQQVININNNYWNPVLTFNLHGYFDTEKNEPYISIYDSEFIFNSLNQTFDLFNIFRQYTEEEITLDMMIEYLDILILIFNQVISLENKQSNI